MGFSVADVLRDVHAHAGPPVTNEELAELRAWLDDEASAATEGFDPAWGPLRLPKRRIADVLACERHVLATLDRDRASEPGPQTVLGMLLDRVVHRWIVRGTCDDPFPHAVAMLEAEGRLDAVRVCQGDSGPWLEQNLAVRAAHVTEWGSIDPAWWPRIEHGATITLAERRVVATIAVDLLVGGPGTDRPGVVLEVKSGMGHPGNLDDLRWYALVLALRDQVSPRLAGVWAADVPSFTPVPIGIDALWTAARRAARAIERLADLAHGAEPAERASFRCSWCPVAARCRAALDVADAATEDDDDPGGDDAWD